LARKILLADDSVTAQNMGRKILADAGYEVITVNNGSAALKKVAEAKPDLIVLDVYMPGYSGLEVCQRLKEASETARIPILLTVGKLEPFKPEEARRARADAFIVKPFEASELLSALTKLEDKVVPRPEPSKPGRFARAIAAVEEGRYDTSVTGDEDSGWKNRISFPSKKKSKVPEPEDIDDPAIYNPVNRDLRTVIEPSPARPAQGARQEDPRVDLAALAPHGLPKDVTPEEIAALAAAAARIKSTDGGKQEAEGRSAETQVTENRVKEECVSESQVTSPQINEPEPPPAVAVQPVVTQAETTVEDRPTAKQEQPAVEIPKEVATAAPVAEAVAERKGEEKEVEASAEKASDAENEAPSSASPLPAETVAGIPLSEPTPYLDADAISRASSGNGSGAYATADEPVTMAAAAEAEFAGTASRWMAVPVALLPEEAAISLQHEMQKTYAALAAAEAAQTAAPEPVAETPPAAVMTLPVEATVAEPPAPAASVPEVATMSSMASAAAHAIKAAVKEFETVAASLLGTHPAAAPEPKPEPTPAQAVEPAVEPPAEVPPVVEAKAEEKEEKEEKKEEQTVAESTMPQLEPEAARAHDAFQPIPQEQEAETKQEEPQALAEAAVAAPAETSPTAEMPETAAPAPVGEVPAEPAAVSQLSPQMTEASAQDKPATGGTDDMAKKEKEIAATTAAAWASWRRIRETGDGKSAPQPPAAPAKQEAAEEPPAPPARDEAAMAVAAGAEQAPVEAPAESESESADIASIVDSVLADLRPKIVEEISRKLGKRK
jgi:CheY-like chemotaxis protein